MRYTDIVRTVVRNAQEKDIPALTWDEQKIHISAIKQKIDDIEIVVRCKDCKYRDTNYGQTENDECRWMADERPNDDDFCSYGERK